MADLRGGGYLGAYASTISVTCPDGKNVFFLFDPAKTVIVYKVYTLYWKKNIFNIDKQIIGVMIQIVLLNRGSSIQTRTNFQMN